MSPGVTQALFLGIIDHRTLSHEHGGEAMAGLMERLEQAQEQFRELWRYL